MKKQTIKWLTTTSALAVLFSSSAFAQSAWEYEPDEGVHAEEWYDPSDWFDDDTSVDLEDLDDEPRHNNHDYAKLRYPVSYMMIYTEAGPNQQQQGRQQQGQSSGQSMEQAVVSGRIDGFRHINLGTSGDQQRDYTIAKIQLENNEDLVVNLGEKGKLDRLNLRKGDQVKLQGVSGKLDGREIFVVNKLKLDDHTVEVNRAFAGINAREQQAQQRSQSQSASSSQNRSFDRQRTQNPSAAQSQNPNRQSYNPKEKQSQSHSSQSPKTVEGTVESFHSTRIQGTNENLTLARLRLENGRSITVDLGSDVASVSEVDIEQGDEVRIRGQIEQVEGRQILKAEEVKVNGQTPQSFTAR